MSLTISPETDFAKTFLIKEFDPTLGDYAPVVTGGPRCYLAYERTDDSAIDPLLDGAATHIGGNGPQPLGTWFFGIDGGGLTLGFLDNLLLDDPDAAKPKVLKAYLVVIKQNGIRVSYEVKYVREPKGTAA